MVYHVEGVDHVMLLNMNDFVEFLLKYLLVEYQFHLLVLMIDLRNVMMNIEKIYQEDYPDRLKYYQKEKHLPIGRACYLEYSKSIVSDFHQI
jgi:hypothetical protein